MISLRRAGLTTVLAVTAALAMTTVPATAALAMTTVPATAAPSADRGPATSHAQQARGLAAYWTPERMRSATPLDLLPVSPGELTAQVRKGTRTLIPPSGPADVGTLAFPNGGSAWTGGGKVVTTSGRVFFTYQGRTASCSGNAVTSTNKSTVLTAGHCVKLGGAWHTNWVFVPAYNNGQTPYGTWAATKTLSTPQWTASENINYDVGAAVVAPLNGQRLTDVVGAQGVAFNTGYNLNMYAFGFPAASPYDGTKLIYCSGRTSRDFFLSQDHGMTCNMTGGSSGGPWFVQFSEATGTGLQASVNSFKYNFFPNSMYGPYFGADAQNLYQQAQTS